MQEKILSWQVRDERAYVKNSSWYWTIGIVGGGVAIASFIIGNLLFGILTVIAVFAIMLAGSRPGTTHTCSISETGVHVGGNFFPFSSIAQFAIREDEPKRLILKTSGFMGTVSLSLEGVDFRAVRQELKNHNIEEVDTLESLGERLADMIGM